MYMPFGAANQVKINLLNKRVNVKMLGFKEMHLLLVETSVFAEVDNCSCLASNR